MNHKSLIKKFEKFKENIKEFIEHEKDSIEDIHTLRINSRELYSLISLDDTFRKKIKKVIKLTNKIRDLDVFFEEYLPSLPKEYIDELDIESILESTNRSRSKDIEKLHVYLKYLSLPESLEFKYIEKKFDYDKINKVQYNQSELHRYRIYIKRVLSKEKNSSEKDVKKIRLLSKIKDILGTMNDNNNGIKRLESYMIMPALFQKIDDFVKRCNLELFEEFEGINQAYMEMTE